MLARLGFDGFIGGNHKKNQIDSTRAGKHVADEPLVPGHIHESDAHVAEIEKREAKINRDPAALLFLEAIRMRARERGHERRLAVINMPGCSDDDVLHHKVGCPRTQKDAASRFGLWGAAKSPPINDAAGNPRCALDYLYFGIVFSAFSCNGGAVVEPLKMGLPSFAIHSPESTSLT